MKQTAVEWLVSQLEILNLIKDGDLENELFRQIELEAKEMEKQQIIDAYENGYSDSDNTFELNKNYYKEKFKINKQFNKETKDVFDELDNEIIKKYLK